MKRLFVVAFLLAALPSGAATAQPVDEPEMRFYTSLAFRESPYADFRGVTPLSKAAALSHNHFRFVYDDHGRLVEISFRLGEELREPNDLANHFFPAPRVRIEYSPGHESRRFFDQWSRPVSVRGGVYREVFTLDSRGYRTSLRFLDRQGLPAENDWGIASYHWRTEADGSVIEWRKSLDGRAVAMRPHLDFGMLRLRYDARGLLAVMQNLDRFGGLLENGSGVAQDKLEYDARGAVVGWNVLDADGNSQRGNHPNVARGVLSYDARGREAGVRYEDESGRPMRSAFGWGQGRTEWDRFGNWRARRFYDEQGRPMVVDGLGYHGYEFEWDETGLRQLAVRFFGLDGEPVEHARRGFASAESEYDDRGRRITVRYLDAAGRPAERRDTGVAVIRESWDSEDRLVGRRFLDVAGEPVVDRRLGYAAVEYRYAPDGYRVAEERLDAEGQPIERSE